MNKEIKSNSGGKLAMYGALGEEGGTEKAKRVNPALLDEKANEENAKKYPGNDVVSLIKALLAVGDIKNAQLMWAGCDKVVELFPELVYDLYRICNIILQPAYEKLISAKNQALCKQFGEESYKSRMKSALITGEEFNPKIPTEFKLKRVLVMDALLDDVQDLKKKERYVFFYKEWDENLPYCHSPEDIESKFMPIMRLAGYKTYLATELIHKLILIAGGLLEREKEYPRAREQCKNIIREFLLPAISFSEGNPGTMASVWEILCRFNFQERYELYDEWYNDFYKDDIETKLLKARTERAVKYVMRRVSKNDIRRCGRDLGKLAHSNPTIVFNVVLDQVQNFDNMAPLMADACRYLGDFSYDVLGYVLTGKWTGSINRNMSKPKEKEDGMPSNWLRSLAVFSGMLYKKQDIDCTPLLRYLAFRLRFDDSVADLVLLNEFVTKMGGIEILASACTDSQITAAGCADSLKTEAFLPISPDNRRASRRVLNRLKESLRRNNIGFEILILLYRLHEVCTSERGIPVSDRCQKLDKVHQTRIQYFELICSLFEGEEYAALVPNVDVLVNTYRLPLEVAMDFNRPKTQYKITQSMEVPVTGGEIWPPIQELVQAVSTVLPDPPTPSMFTAEFYALFWQLSLYDIYCPTEHYDAAINRHTEMIRQCQDPRSSYCQANRDSVVRKSERQAQASLEALREDLPKHKAHVEKVMTILQDSCTRWFPSSMHRTDLINNILQHCILPRGRQSEVDAVYCFEFALLMHKLNTKNLSSLTLFDKLLSEHMPAILICFTEYETTIQSRFLFRTLSKMATWRKDKDFYYEQSHGKDLIGFQKNWSSQPTAEVSKEDLLSYNDFLRVLVKWHNKIYIALEQAMKSDEPHLIKNAFLVLRQFLPCFPATVEHGDNIAAIVKKLSDEENARPNLKVLARSYNGLISKSKAKWVSKNKFLGIKDPAPAAPPLELKIAPAAAAAASITNTTTTTITTSTSESRSDETSSRRRDDGTSRSNTDRDDTKRRDDRSSSQQPKASTTDRDESSSKRRDDYDSRRGDDRDSSRRDDRESRHDRDSSRRDDRDSRRGDDRSSRRSDDRDKREDRDSKRDDRDSKRDDRDSKREDRSSNGDSKKREGESSSSASTRHGSSSRQASPGRTSESKLQAPPSPSSDRKRSREHDSSRREGESGRLKSPRVDESSNSNSRRRTPSSAPSSSRHSPRDSPVDTSSRTGTPYRDSTRREVGIRESARDSPRSDTTSSRAGGGRLTANNSPLPSHDIPPTNNNTSSTTTSSSSSSNMRSSRIESSSSSSRHDDRHSDSLSKGAKRGLDEGRDRDERPDKRRYVVVVIDLIGFRVVVVIEDGVLMSFSRDIRPDRMRDDRPRIEDRLRMDSRPRMEDRLRVDDRRDDRLMSRDRRIDDRRPDTRRDRDVRDQRSSRRR